MKEVYTYKFDPTVVFEDVEASLLLASFGVESLHGESQTHLDARYYVDANRRACVIDASTTAGADMNRLFVGYLRREYGTELFQVKRIEVTGDLAGAVS